MFSPRRNGIQIIKFPFAKATAADRFPIPTAEHINVGGETFLFYTQWHPPYYLRSGNRSVVKYESQTRYTIDPGETFYGFLHPE